MKRLIAVLLMVILLTMPVCGALADVESVDESISYIEDAAIEDAAIEDAAAVEPRASRTISVYVDRGFTDLYDSLFRQQYIYVAFTGTEGPRTVEVRLVWYDTEYGDWRVYDQKSVELNGIISWTLPRAAKFELDVVTGRYDLREGDCTFVVTGHS